MANRAEDSDSDSDHEIENGVANLTVDNDGDDMLSINSAMFHKDDWRYIESEKGNVALFMKLAEYGQKIDDVEVIHQKVLCQEDYAFMRNEMLVKLGSWSTKYLPASVPTAAPTAAAKGNNKKGGGNKKNAAPSKAEIIVRMNTQKLLKGDVDYMRITADVGVSEVTKWHQPASLLLYLVYWALHVIHALKGKLKGDNSKVMNVSSRVAMDCYMSLYRAARDMADVVPPMMLEDVKLMDEHLHTYLTSKITVNLLGTLVISHPELITDTHYDVVKPKNIALYAEQQAVLQMVNDSLVGNKPLLIGYQVPPSGGKTILSVAVAAMLSHKFRTKRVLYICYNTLVRKAVANACAQAALPFWVASTRQVSSGEASAIRPSNACLNMSRRAKRERWMAAQSSGFRNKEGEMDVMFAKAENLTVHHCPIIIADLASAIRLLQLFPDDFVAYVDEPTAGAERGFDHNKITELVAQICSLLPAQSVLLSATLPNIPTELPSLAQHFLNKHGGEGKPVPEVKMVSSLRLPVGCDALDPTGKMVLPHQLADSFEEFKMVVSRMDGDALMQRFYTPSSVKGLAVAVEEKVGRDVLPTDLWFENVIPHIGAVRHATIRAYGQRLLEYVASSNREDIFECLKTLAVSTSSDPLVPCDPANLLTHHCSDGRALAVATTRTVISEDAVERYESLDTLVKLAMAPFAPRMPKLKNAIADYKRRVDKWAADGASLANSKVSKRDKDAAATLQADLIAHEQTRPGFDWPIKVHGRGGGLPFAELETMADEVASLLLSGVGYYDPHTMTYNETVSVVKEATEGRLACLFASPFIVYGTNIDLTTVFIGSSYSRGATRNALYQLIGRAGRTGKSHRAKVLFQDFEALKKAMIPTIENTEAAIIEHHFQIAMGAMNK